MSDLKHMTEDQLRYEIRSLEKSRAKLEQAWIFEEQEIVNMQARIAEMRHKHHNLGQRECWARIYLARKEP